MALLFAMRGQAAVIQMDIGRPTGGVDVPAASVAAKGGLAGLAGLGRGCAGIEEREDAVELLDDFGVCLGALLDAILVGVHENSPSLSGPGALERRRGIFILTYAYILLHNRPFVNPQSAPIQTNFRNWS